MQYTLESDDQETVEALLNLATLAAGVQIDEESKEDAYALIDAVADMFRVEKTRVIIDEYDEEDGSVTLNIRTEHEETKPHLTLVKDTPNANDNDEKSD